MNPRDQAYYFDQDLHRFDETAILQPPYSMELELQTLEQSLSLPKGSHLVDFGCGSGRVTFYFLSHGYNVTGVDVSNKSLKGLKNFYQKHRQPSWGKLKTATTLSKNLSHIDGIVGADILHHVQLPEYLPRFYDLLPTGGRIAFSEPNAWHLPWYAFIILQKLPWSIEKGIMQCSIPNLQKQILRSGFGRVQIRGFGLLPMPLCPPFNPLLVRNSTLGNLPFLKSIAFRIIPSATKL